MDQLPGTQCLVLGKCNWYLHLAAGAVQSGTVVGIGEGMWYTQTVGCMGPTYSLEQRIHWSRDSLERLPGKPKVSITSPVDGSSYLAPGIR